MHTYIMRVLKIQPISWDFNGITLRRNQERVNICVLACSIALLPADCQPTSWVLLYTSLGFTVVTSQGRVNWGRSPSLDWAMPYEKQTQRVEGKPGCLWFLWSPCLCHCCCPHQQHQTPALSVFQHGLKTHGPPGVLQAVGQDGDLGDIQLYVLSSTILQRADSYWWNTQPFCKPS